MPDRLSELGRAALLEITSADSIGAEAGRNEESDSVVSLFFECTLPGYPGWHWTVSIATLEGQEPSVLEAELLPAEGALLAPEWVPWSERLAEYKAAQKEAAALAGTAEMGDAGEPEDDEPEDDEPEEDEPEDDEPEEDEPEDDDDLDDLELDEDDEPHPVLHGGDLDGVDIDELAPENVPEDSPETGHPES